MGYSLVDAYAAVQKAKHTIGVCGEIEAFLRDFQDDTEAKPHILKSITPNPASSSTTVNYDIKNGAASAYLIMVKQSGNTPAIHHILDVNAKQTTINISNYATGLYTIALIVDGEISDSKTLLKQ